MADNNQKEVRSTDAALIDMMTQLHADVAELKASLGEFVNGVDSETHALQHEYIKLVIEKEKERAAVRRAIIEKTLASLIWSALVAIGYALWQTFSGHPISPSGK